MDKNKDCGKQYINDEVDTFDPDTWLELNSDDFDERGLFYRDIQKDYRDGDYNKYY